MSILVKEKGPKYNISSCLRVRVSKILKFQDDDRMFFWKRDAFRKVKKKV